jgi:chemotaxis protein MotB
MADQHEQPIFIKKKKSKGHHGGHGGAWKVAYADFVTAMMALFIVLWVLAQSEEVKQAVAGYFRDPAGFDMKSGSKPGSRNEVINLQLEAKRLQMEMQQKKFEELKGKITEEIKQNPTLSKISDQVDITMVKEGLKIEMLESTSNVFFDIGSSHLNNKAEEILNTIGGNLKILPNMIAVEGHTDSRKYIGDIKNYDNFNLSADRANAAKTALAKGGVNESQIDEIRGYADKRLRDKKDPFNVVNRRISIIIKYTE